ncbi:DNA-directed DNA polymerase alpha catalytic subunit pol1 [Ceratocystis pirilliformis]|uniref:DNA polymerase n=1 Tax=Ceratocystis pirilliformis TaxID=259994 RepID=A0ABR3Z2S5_9PEZI
MSSAAARRAKLEQLRASRAAGKKIALDVGEVDSFYEEVDETQYKKIVRDRLNRDDFVVDDNGEGYADDGREEWDREQPPYDYSDDDEALERGRPKISKKKKVDEQAKRDANDRDITNFFSKGAVSRPKTKTIKTKDDDDFMGNLLSTIDTPIPAPMSSPRHKKRERSPTTDLRKVRVQSPPTRMDLDDTQPTIKRTKITDERATSMSSPPLLPMPTPHELGHDSDDDFNDLPDVPDDFGIVSDQIAAPSSPTAKVALRKQIKQEANSDDDGDFLEVSHAGTIKARSVNLSSTKPVPPRPIMKPILKPTPYIAPDPPKLFSSSPVKADTAYVDASAWNNLMSKLDVESSTASDPPAAGKVDPSDVQLEDGSINFFWTDQIELGGALHLFGKVFNKKTKQHISCYIKLQGIMRMLFFLPRNMRVVEGRETDEEVGHQDVYQEIDSQMTRMGVDMFKTKLCKRKYAFELEGIPREADYFKVLYPYTKPALDANLKGQTFSHIFGANTAMFEQFVLLKNIMGPCWLKIKDANFTALQNASHCKLEVLVRDPDLVSVMSDRDAPEEPPLTMMSLALRTMFNARDNKQEILALSFRVYENVSLTDPTPAQKLRSQTFTLVRPAIGQPLPMGFEAAAKVRNKGLIKPMRQENEILAFFLAKLELIDPDVILGHQLEGVDFSILLNRLREKKTPTWSRIGRLRRAAWPSALSRTGGNVFAERQLLCGRLLCDLANDAGKSIMTKCQSWSLSEMCSLYLPSSSHVDKRLELDNEEALATWAMRDKRGLMNYLAHLEADTYYIAALAIQVQMLPLTKVLTNLAGNTWARTLTGTRAERNEYILLHEFHRKKYICPDKQTFKGPPTKVEDEIKEEEGAASKKKDKYKGGLVFEPEKGLYDRYVLVMDFNSLYPSIIQEFNICFTTVDRFAVLEDEDSVPEVPKNTDQGVLPRLIATLVQRRREVKKYMKNKDATPEQLATWDIRQLALKLTANSMYGCLGYTKSRFYARPLAMLTTHMGREILMSTKALAETHQLQVIYGDTDSVMINANVDNAADAIKVGEAFKRAVNERYRLLEIDIDNIFRRILLQAKKKYAAINLTQKDGKWVEKMEVKGLDMKRREYCALSKEISSRILDNILSGHEAEVAIERIHEYLRDIAAKMRAREIPTQKYIIYTQLGKGPKEYPNGDSMPQVQVALRDIARGKTVRRLDVISYIITSDESSSDPPPKRAYSSADVLKPDSGMTPDVEWYMGKQIFPPVERLCANIRGTSTSQLAEQLGLDIKRYAGTNSSFSGGGLDLEVHPLESQIPDSTRFADCTRLSLQCRICRTKNTFEGITGSLQLISPAGITCGKCSSVFSTLSVVAQLEAQLRAATARYYEAWLICNDSQCANRTRQMSVYGTRCLGPRGLARDCRGVMRYEISEKAIYTQLVYFASLFDVDRARKAADVPSTGSTKTGSGTVVDHDGSMSDVQREQIRALVEQNRVRFTSIRGVCDKYLEKCGRGWVAMDSIFMRLGLLKPTTT